MKEIQDFKAEIKKDKKNQKQEIIKYKTSKLLDDLIFEKGTEIDKINKIEAKLEKLTAAKRGIDKIKEPIIWN